MATLLLSACGSPSILGGSPDVTLVAADGLPEPTRVDLLSSNRPYLIGPFDKLKIDVFGIEDLSNKEVQIDASGRLSFPLIGVVEASGLTPGELAKLEDVVIFRSVNGQQLAGLYNLKAIRRGTYNDPEVFANDVIVVGDSQARRLFQTLIQASPLITTPLIILFRQ